MDSLQKNSSTFQNLQKRKIIESELCPLCCLYTEFTSHALWECEAARDVWGQRCWMVQKVSFTSHSFRYIWQKLSSKLNVSELAEATMISKMRWTRMNEFIHQKSFSHLNVLITKAQDELKPFHQVHIAPNKRKENQPPPPIH